MKTETTKTTTKAIANEPVIENAITATDSNSTTTEVIEATEAIAETEAQEIAETEATEVIAEENKPYPSTPEQLAAKQKAIDYAHSGAVMVVDQEGLIDGVRISWRGTRTVNGRKCLCLNFPLRDSAEEFAMSKTVPLDNAWMMKKYQDFNQGDIVRVRLVRVERTTKAGVYKNSLCIEDILPMPSIQFNTAKKAKIAIPAVDENFFDESIDEETGEVVTKVEQNFNDEIPF